MKSLFEKQPVRQAVQSGLAVGLAIAFGNLVSGQRWYWAVIAAYIVGFGVGSRGEALIKALQRLAGTILGIVVGIFIASAISGHTDLALGLVLVCVFFAFYAFQAAYGIMMFCITLMLALLYGLVGQFRPELLVLRLEETALGAALAVLVTMFVLPIRERDVFAQSARELLDAMARTVQETRGQSRIAAEKAAGDMQAKAQALRGSIGSLKRGWIQLVPMRYRRAVRAGMRCAYFARELVLRGTIGDREADVVLQEIEAVRRELSTGMATGRSGAAQTALDAADLSRETPGDEAVGALIGSLRRFRQRLGEM